MKTNAIIFTPPGMLLIGFVLYELFVPRLKQHVKSVECDNLMSSIGIGARIWAGDNCNHMADNFLCMSNEPCTPKFLICPSDKIGKPADSWASFTNNNCSCEILRPNMPADDFSNAFFRCTIHGHLGFADGTMFDGIRRRTKSFY